MTAGERIVGTPVDPSAVEAFRMRLRGQLIGPDQPEYESARRVYNAMIDKHPALIACCVDVADVIAAVEFGRAQGLLLSVRGGGHNAGGLM
jgi:FAD/FMN-containing dehydrogenase